jgi:large subunit ribosomal protein L21
MDYAIVESGGKQYVAREGQTLEIDRVAAEVGEPVTFERVLLVVDGGNVRIGTPLVDGIKVHATVAEHTKGDKIVVFRYIPKERYRRKSGHRQQYTRVIVGSIGEPTARPAPVREAKAPAPAKKRAASRPKPARTAKKADAPKPKAKTASKKK